MNKLIGILSYFILLKTNIYELYFDNSSRCTKILGYKRKTVDYINVNTNKRAPQIVLYLFIKDVDSIE